MTKLFPFVASLLLLLDFSTPTSAQTITNQPQSLTVNIASTATFTVGASNALTYQWQFNGLDISGATNSSLTLEDVMTNQAGNYTVVVTASNTPPVTSSPAALTIIPGTIVTFKLAGLPSGTNYIDVELFSHDKPITVQNFLHYVVGGGYSNMFFHRCATGFVLQGGVFGATDRTNTSPPLNGWEIQSQYIDATNLYPPYPQQIVSEFGFGSEIHNRFGTLVMALSANTNSANSSFFFNLADNSGSLDSDSFTVFGRIIDQTNVLNYFNNLGYNTGVATNAQIYTNGVLDVNGTSQLAANFGGSGGVPVNYIGTNAPGNANLVFCDFLYTNAPLETNIPTVAITAPTNALLTNSFAGTATDAVGVAGVICTVTPQATDGTFPYPYTNAAPETNYATGTTNWSLSLYAGVYNVSVQSQNGAGYLSPPVAEVVTNTAVVIVGNGTVAFTNAALAGINPVGYPMQVGSNYGLVAIPGSSNEVFAGWSGAYATTDSSTNFSYDGSVLTATFVSNVVGGIAFTSPTNNEALSNYLFDITGTVATNLLTLPVTVTVRIFTNSSSNYSVTSPQSVITSNGNWSVATTNYLPTGSYTIQALATDAASNQTLITENFTFTPNTNAPLTTITSPAPGTILYEGNPIIIQGTATSQNGVPLASAGCNMIPIANEADGVAPNGGTEFGAYAVGTTNWTLDLVSAVGNVPPGQYTLSAQAEDAAGNIGTPVTQPLTVSAIQILGGGSITLQQGTNNKPNPIGYPLQSGTTYTLTAAPGAGQSFVNWNDAGYITTNKVFSFVYNGGLLTATFISNTAPRGLTFTYPRANARLTTNNFTIKGTIENSAGSANVTCQLHSLTTGLQVGPLLTTTGNRTWSIPVTNLPPDAYMIQAMSTNANGFSTVIDEEFALLDFKASSGTYNGLFICTSQPVNSTNSGFLTMNLNPLGSFSARIYFPAYPFIPLDSFFYDNGDIYFPYPILANDPLKLSLSIDLTNVTDTITGTLTSAGWSAPVVLYRAATKLSTQTTPATGKYVLNLTPENWGNTNGYATVSASAGGTLAVSGALPDGATFSQSTGVGTNGVWPLYAMPTGYKTNGILMGWETNEASGYSSGRLYWFKTNNVGNYYTSGVNVEVNSAGTNYIAPATGNYSIVFQGGTLTNAITNELTVARDGAPFKVVTASDKLALSISPNGVLTGHFVNPADNKTLQFKGAFFGQTQGGSGFFLDSGGKTGYFSLNAE